MCGSCRPRRVARQCAGKAGRYVRPKIPTTRISGQRRQATTAVRGKAGAEGYARAAAVANAGEADGVALFPVRHDPAKPGGDAGKLSEVRVRVALVQTMHVLRSVEPVRVHAADPRADPAQGCKEQV